VKSFEEIMIWYEELKKQTDDNVVKMLVGNKSDLEHLRKVDKFKAITFAGKQLFS
jgi:Ras-related protein Rab-11A